VTAPGEAMKKLIKTSTGAVTSVPLGPMAAAVFGT